MTSPRFSARHIFIAGASVFAVAVGPIVAGLAAQPAPHIVAAPGCTTTASKGSFSLACSPGSTPGSAGLASEEQLTWENMFDREGRLAAGLTGVAGLSGLR